MTLLLINTTLLLLLAALHFYWAFGGQWGFAAALPTTADGQRVLHPNMRDSLAVGLALLVFGLFHLVRMELIPVPLPAWLADYGLWGIGGVFLLRAVGDFHYVGFFKKIRSTPFAKYDTWYYSPLCILIGVIALAVETFV